MGVVCFLALDSNLGDREQYLMNALYQISSFDKTNIQCISNIWEGYPVGYLEQENFLNIVIKIAMLIFLLRVLNVLKLRVFRILK